MQDFLLEMFSAKQIPRTTISHKHISKEAIHADDGCFNEIEIDATKHVCAIILT